MAVLNKSDYLLSLERENKDIAARYKEKIRVIQCVDPYTFTPEDTDTSIENFPPVTAFDMSSYLVLTHSFYTNQQMKAYKSLAGYKYFEAGFVQDCEAKKIGDHIVVIAKVKHSQRMNDPLLQVWRICEIGGAIHSAHCTCMAGHSEVCSHVAAVLYGLEYINQSAKNSSCTDVKAKWLIPSISNVPIISVSDMKLTKHSIKHHAAKNAIPAIEGEELSSFLQEIKDSGDEAALMRVVEPFASEISATIPRSLLPSVYDIFKEEYEVFTYTDLCSLALQVDEKLSTQQCKDILEASVNQNKSKEWFNQRRGRITASNFKRACKTSILKPSLSLIKAVCYPLDCQFKSKATEWGLHHESIALETYKLEQMKNHLNLKLKKAGLYVCAVDSFLGASPDAVVSCDCCGSGCVEVKCPYLLKDMEMGQYLDMKSSPLTCNSGVVSLDRKHAYYYQTQLQIKVTDSKYCDFVIWSPKGFFHERIFRDEDFWMINFPKAYEFHKKVILPELLGKYFTKGRHLDQRWCVCGKSEEGRIMIQCENDSCEVEWFHLECVGLLDIPNRVYGCVSSAFHDYIHVFVSFILLFILFLCFCTYSPGDSNS